MFRKRMLGMRDILLAPDAALVDQVRCVSAVFTTHAGMIALDDLPGTGEEKRKAVLEVATTLVTGAHLGGHTSWRCPGGPLRPSPRCASRPAAGRTSAR
ncbi:hypothetical protein SY2F82_36160 [Streptomyces sp. Y2F8-2]|nr:hypothetical protein SY2F82_36160 [Streptomyces sp. Y2F8-2]